MRRPPEPSRSERGGRDGRPSRASTAGRALSVGLIAAGVLVLAWVFVTWRWQEPITAIEHWRDQGALAAQLRNRHAPARAGSLRLQARAFRFASHDGEAMGRILIPRLGLDTVLVEGTSEADLTKDRASTRETFFPEKTAWSTSRDTAPRTAPRLRRSTCFAAATSSRSRCRTGRSAIACDGIESCPRPTSPSFGRASEDC